MVVKEFDQKNWSLTFGYGYSHDIAGRCGIGGACTPFDVVPPLERGAFNGGLAWVVNRDTLASEVTFDLIIENGDQSKPYRYIAMFSPTVAPDGEGRRDDRLRPARTAFRRSRSRPSVTAATASPTRAASPTGSTVRRSGSTSASPTTRGASRRRRPI